MSEVKFNNLTIDNGGHQPISKYDLTDSLGNKVTHIEFDNGWKLRVTFKPDGSHIETSYNMLKTADGKLTPDFNDPNPNFHDQ
ncbi:MAG: hypothetical protein ABF899_01490 [Oenococcus sp.]|uniref:hypothetical protein n=1 Tax=Oenococcus sp. TaxID=1979414 RepID=UPI0039EA9B1E